MYLPVQQLLRDLAKDRVPRKAEPQTLPSRHPPTSDVSQDTDSQVPAVTPNHLPSLVAQSNTPQQTYSNITTRLLAMLKPHQKPVFHVTARQMLPLCRPIYPFETRISKEKTATRSTLHRVGAVAFETKQLASVGFPDLPFEVQDMIWRCALEDYRHRVILWRERDGPVLQFHPIAHACRRSRAIYLQENTIEFWQTPGQSTGILAINWKHNIVYFDAKFPGLTYSDMVPRQLPGPVVKPKPRPGVTRVRNVWVTAHIPWIPYNESAWLASIRHIALDICFYQTLRDFRDALEETGWMFLDARCINLKTLTVVVKPVEEGDRVLLPKVLSWETIHEWVYRCSNRFWWESARVLMEWECCEEKKGLLEGVELRMMDGRGQAENEKCRVEDDTAWESTT